MLEQKKNLSCKRITWAAIASIANDMEGILSFCYENIPWEQELDYSLALYSKDFRNIYHELYMWNMRSIRRDGSINSEVIEEKAGKLVKYIYSLVLSSDISKNAVEAILESALVKYLNGSYTFEKGINVSKLAKQIISNAISRAAVISYKLYDRHIIYNCSIENIEEIYKNPTKFIKPPRALFDYDVIKRTYYTDTACLLSMYCYLLAKFIYNMESHYINIFKTIIETELEKLEGKA